MNPFQRFNAIAFAWCILAIGGLAACSTSDPSAGTPYPGGSSSPPTPPPEQACSTGTQLALADPLPGTRVMATTRPIKIVSNHAISDADAALVLETLKDVTTSPRPLFGPIRKPKHSPAPFRRNVYYEARGFELQPSTTYKVEVASIESNCKPDPISGAIFKTKALTLRPALVTVGGLSRFDFRAVVGVIIEHSGGAASLNENLPIR